ncbi:unannotated protein [freshwater metagenome]|uniref:Unannotated protein n=1 Tax=freshwater metagenome TaxID=449393 RepID=A0A6J7DHW9_9ZZZZ
MAFGTTFALVSWEPISETEDPLLTSTTTLLLADPEPAVRPSIDTVSKANRRRTARARVKAITITFLRFTAPPTEPPSFISDHRAKTAA